MEPLFVCEVEPSVRRTAELINQHNTTRRWILLLFSVGFFLYMLSSVMIYFWFFGFDLWVFLMLLLSLAYCLYGIFMPWINAWFAVRRTQKALPGVKKIVSFGEKIVLRHGGVTVRLDYAQIQRVLHLKYSYELIKSKNERIVVEPGSFTKGTFAEFKQFLRQKRPDLLIPE